MTVATRLALLATTLSILNLPATLGAQGDELPRRGMLGALLETDQGGQVVVRRVLPNGAAKAMGLEPGATLHSINGAPVTSLPMFLQTLGTMRTGSRLEVTANQGGRTGTFSAALPAMAREQYAGAAVSYGTARTPAGVRLRTVLVAPSGRPPVVLYLQGVGCGTIDRPFAPDTDTEMRLLRGLVAAGYATLRVDRTGTGDSEGIPCSEAGFDAELEAGRAALAWVRTRQDVDPGRVILLGISMGGVVAPLLAAEPGVAGIAVWGTIGRNLLEYQQRNIRRQLPREDLLPEQAESTVVARIEAMARLLFLLQSPAEVKANPRLVEALPVSDSTHMFGRHARFWQELQRIDTPGSWARVRVPTLALHGTFDWVSDPEDHQLIADIVNRNGGCAEYREVPGLDHAMTSHGSLQESYRDYAQGTLSDAPLEEVRTWLGAVFGA